MNRATLTGQLIADPVRCTVSEGIEFGRGKFYAAMPCGASIMCDIIAAPDLRDRLLSFQEGDKITASGKFALSCFDDWRGKPQPLIEVLVDEITACPEGGD